MLHATYSHHCTDSCNHLELSLDDSIFKDIASLVEQMLRAVWDKDLDDGDVFIDLIEKEAGILFNAVSIDIEPGSLSDEMLDAFRYNTAVLSTFKNHQFSRELHALILDGEQISTWEKFRDEAANISQGYYENWLKAEYETAIASGQMAARWLEHVADADIFPYLQYQTVGDDRVRPEHIALDGITRRIDDPFWRNYFPPNGWRCRCDVIQVGEGETDVPADLPELPRGFSFNPGLSGSIVGDDHPYFTTIEEAKQTLTDIATNISEDATTTQE